MSEPIAERLSRFTPDAAGLDRDALLFAAGRASARPALGWKALAAALAACQVFTLVALWSRTAGVVPSAAPNPPPAVAPSPPVVWPARMALAAEGEWRAPSDAGPLVPDQPPLHVFSTPPDDLLY